MKLGTYIRPQSWIHQNPLFHMTVLHVLYVYCVGEVAHYHRNILFSCYYSAVLVSLTRSTASMQLMLNLFEMGSTAFMIRVIFLRMCVCVDDLVR